MDGLTAVVTGASRGIGEAVARRFAAAGARVVVSARERDALDAVVADIKDEGGEIEGLRADVRDEFDVERLMETAARGSDGGIDAVAACESVAHGALDETPLSNEPYSAFDDTLRTNARGVFATIREALPHLADDARVLVPSAAAAREPKPGGGSYAVSKAAAEAVARGFAADIEQAVSVVDPGRVATEPNGGEGSDFAEVAALFEWAATEASVGEIDGEIVGLEDYRKATA